MSIGHRPPIRRRGFGLDFSGKGAKLPCTTGAKEEGAIYGWAWRVLVIVGGGAWVVTVLGRLPSDLAFLRILWQRMRTRRDPDVLARMEMPSERRAYQEQCVREFWITLAVHVLFFWPSAILISLYLIAVVFWGIIPAIRHAL